MLATSIIWFLVGIAAVALAGIISVRGVAQNRKKSEQAAHGHRRTDENRPTKSYEEANRNRENPEAMKTAAGGRANERFPFVRTGSR